jgi:hypothetical protein
LFHFRFSGAVPVHHISQDMFLYEFSTRLCSASILYDTILILLDRLVIIANICCFDYLMLCLLDANQDNQTAPKITKFCEILSKFCNTFEAVESTIRTGRTKAFITAAHGSANLRHYLESMGPPTACRLQLKSITTLQHGLTAYASQINNRQCDKGEYYLG